jgi:hypothetical protein
MKTLLIPNLNNKFYRNLTITQSNNFKILANNELLQGNVYGLYYRTKFDYIIVPSSLLSNSIVQFAIEYASSVKIILDIDSDLPTEFIDAYKNVFYFLTTNINTNNRFLLKPSFIINEKLYNNNDLNKQNFIVCFLDNCDSLPTELMDYLYPNSNLKIKMFNGVNIPHHQNIGMINEIERADILKNAEYYLVLNNESYAIEAKLSGCKLLNLDTIKNMEEISLEIPKYTTYEQLLQDIL